MEIVNILEETRQGLGVRGEVADEAHQQPGATGNTYPVLLSGVPVTAVFVVVKVACHVLFRNLHQK